MGYRLVADFLLLMHLGFILFVVAGGLLCFRQPRWAWLHLPAVSWGVWVELAGWVCPLTPLENHFRLLGAGKGYTGGFIEHYLVSLLYPDQLTAALQWTLGFLALGINLLVYGMVLSKRRKATGVDE